MKLCSMILLAFFPILSFANNELRVSYLAPCMDTPKEFTHAPQDCTSVCIGVIEGGSKFGGPFKSERCFMVHYEEADSFKYSGIDEILKSLEGQEKEEARKKIRQAKSLKELSSQFKNKYGNETCESQKKKFMKARQDFEAATQEYDRVAKGLQCPSTGNSTLPKANR